VSVRAAVRIQRVGREPVGIGVVGKCELMGQPVCTEASTVGVGCTD
jgi:hypothetical protein